MPHLIHIAIGFPPAAKSSSYRLRATANLFAEAGWDVTVINAAEKAWLRESGIDRSMMEGVHPAIEIVELDASRTDLEPDIRTYSKLRARYPQRWLEQQRAHERELFPEPVWGEWRPAIEAAVEEVHARKPVDLVLSSSVPYTTLAGAWKLFESHGVPYVMDFRDGWSLNVMKGGLAYAADTPERRWEAQMVEHALAMWTVNDPIAEHYRELYPQSAAKIKVVRNGFDPMPEVTRRSRSEDDGLTFGYLGTASFSGGQLKALLAGWRAARQIEPILERSELVFHGHIGISSGRGTHALLKLILDAAPDGVRYAGPVPKAEVSRLYSQWDAAVLLLPGGRYMTSGKVYEYLATGLPIMSAHAHEHEANNVLRDYPLWVPPPETWSAENVVVSFVKTARLAVAATDDMHRSARAYADQYSRRATMMPAVEELTAQIDPAPTAIIGDEISTTGEGRRP